MRKFLRRHVHLDRELPEGASDSLDGWRHHLVAACPPSPEERHSRSILPLNLRELDGKVGVSWLDRRNDPNDIDYQAFAAISEDGGQSFGTNRQLTTAFSDPRVNGTQNNWMGDYTGNTLERRQCLRGRLDGQQQRRRYARGSRRRPPEVTDWWSTLPHLHFHKT